MKKILKFLIIFSICTILILPSADAWKGVTHKNVADQIYKAMPSNIKSKLNITMMEGGSLDPDRKFKDFPNHIFPGSYKKAAYWLERGRNDFKSKNYKNASYCFGVASHYISDTFSAPHCVSKEGTLHGKYEQQAASLTPVIKYISGSLNKTMTNGYQQGKSDWNNWVKNRTTSLVQKHLNSGASAAYSAIKNCIT